MKKMYSLLCTICGQKLMEAEQPSTESFGFAQLKIEHRGDHTFGLICDDCANLVTERPVEKIIKKAVRAGNSSCVLLPKHHEGKMIVSYVLDKKEV